MGESVTRKAFTRHGLTNETEILTIQVVIHMQPLFRVREVQSLEAFEGWTQKRRPHVWSFDSAQEEGTILKNVRLLRSRGVFR
jgi:hypothetical protein